MFPINPSTLRQIWSVIEGTQTSTLLKFSEAELIQLLLRELDNQNRLSTIETNTVEAYIHSRVPLIRDMAQARLA